MKISAPVHVEARLGGESSRAELALRYAAAYASTLIAVLATQPVVPTELGFLLLAITLLGWPLSLAMRARLKADGVHFGSGRVISRFAINSSVVIASAGFALLLLTGTMAARGIEGGAMYLLLGDARSAISLLMQVFLIFACCRCLAILTDKDAVLCAVPSFSVLLLLMVVQGGDATVVAYFLVWILVTAALFALDHRAESRVGAAGRVPSVVPGQDAALSARGLMSVLALSLACASVLSTFLSSGNTAQQGDGSSIFNTVFSRLGGLTFSASDVSVNSGPERQIDFNSGPSLPTRAELWIVRAHNIDTGRIIEPQYWRMFTFGGYDGRSWSQIGGSGTQIPRSELAAKQWPLSPLVRYPHDFYRSRRAGRTVPTKPLVRPNRRVPGYDISKVSPDRGGPSRAFGATPQGTIRVGQLVVARVDNIGFIPALPAPRAILTDSDEVTMRVRDDYAVDAGVVEARFNARGQQLWSEVAGPEYGGNGEVPTRTDQAPNPGARLSAKERQDYLDGPERGFPPRLLALARRTLATAPRTENNFARAQRLSAEIQRGATYTLRPPILPEGQDAADYFLHEGGRRGYCTYFAGALATLCRASGIPARVVTGFVSPERLEFDLRGRGGFFLLRESMAHAWTEVWVPGWGWATLDPTPPDNRGNNAPGFWDNATDLLGSVLENGRNWTVRNRSALLLVGALIALLGLTWGAKHLPQTPDAYGTFGFRLAKMLGRTRDVSQEELARVEAFRLYDQTTRRLGRAFRPRQSWETPSEYLSDAQTHLSIPDWMPLQRVTSLYERARYSPAPVSPDEIAHLRASLAKLAWKPPRSKWS